MALIGRVLGARRAASRVGKTIGGVAEVFVGNQAEREAAAHGRYVAALEQFAKESAAPRAGWFGSFVDALNRLPRPIMALGTLGLFVFAMAAPAAFAVRMRSLALVPEPLWWLLGAVVSFYFGARELHHWRESKPVELPRLQAATLFDASAPGTPASDETQSADTPDAPDSAPPSHSARPQPRPADHHSEPAPIEVRAADPGFNAALEEWRKLSS